MKRLYAILFALIIVWFPAGSETILTGISATAGERGLALLLVADKPIVGSFKNVLHRKNSKITITLEDVVYGLDAFTFSAFPSKSPIRKIVATEKENNVIITVTLKHRVLDKIRTKHIKSKTVFLISSSPFSKYNWKVTGGKSIALDKKELKIPKIKTVNKTTNNKTNKAIIKTINNPTHKTVSKTKNNVEQKTISKTTNIAESNALNKTVNKSVIKSIHFLRRGSVEKLTIYSDNPVSVRVKQKKKVIILVYDHATSGLAKKIYSLPSNALFKKISIKENKKNSSKNRIGIVIEKTSDQCCIEIKKSKVIIFSTPQKTKSPVGLASWTTDGNDNYCFNFNTDTVSEKPIDNIVHSKNKEYEKNDTGNIRMVVVRNNVNIRSDPTMISSENIINSVNKGSVGTLVRKKTPWYFMRFDNADVAGWIYKTMVNDSIKITQKREIKEVKTSEIPKSLLTRVSTASISKKALPKKRKTKKPKIEKPKQVKTEPVLQIPPKPELALISIEPEKKITKYTVFGRDPFVPLTDMENLELGLLDVEKCVLVGILYDINDKIVLLESPSGEAFSLRENNKVLNGQVLKIKQKSVTFLLRESGFSRRFVLNFKQKVK